MQRRLKTALVAALLLTGPIALAAAPAAAQPAASTRPEFKQGSMNIYRRFKVEDREKMVGFYEKVLALLPLSPINLGGGQQMILFKVGSGQIKLAAGLKEDRKYALGGAKDGTGIRLFTLYFPDEAQLAERFKAAGYPAPEFKATGGGRKAALVRDPAGFPLELIIVPGAPADLYATAEVGIAVSDLQRSRVFYKDFAGLDEQAPVRDEFLGVTKHPFRHGQTTVNLWEVGKGLPADTGSAGIQYVIGNVEAMNAEAAARKITVETPLGGVAGFNIKTVWLNDPDGVTNYFYQLMAPRPGAPGQQQAAARAPAAPQ